MFRSACGFFIIALVLAGCNLHALPRAEVAAAQTDAESRTATAPPAPTETEIPPSPSQLPAPPPTPDSCPRLADGPARRVAADIEIDFATKTIDVAQRITFANREDSPLHEIVLDAQANQWEGGFALDELTLDGAALEWTLRQNQLTVALPAPLLPGCVTEVALNFRLQPPAIRDGLRAYRGFFGYSPRQLNLGHFLPTVAARIGGAWRIHQPSGIGEQLAQAVADWQVSLTVINAADSLKVAAPGTVKAMGAGEWDIRLAKSRDFAISLSEEFILSEAVTADGVTVAVYTFADALVFAGGQWLDGAGHALAESVRALELFSREFGPYSDSRFTLVQGDFPDGMEFTGLVFVGSAWFANFDGTAYNYLTLISVHEIAHQWWYAQVGNDAALNPWLDEALATYSEYIFIEEFYPADKNWWWTFRVANFFPQGEVDSRVYEFTSARAYINAVYLRGVQMLQNLREDIGNDAFFDLLRAYRKAGTGAIAEPALFWGQLNPEQLDATADTRRAFLREPNVIADVSTSEAIEKDEA